MAIFQHPLWGYQLTLPEAWVYAEVQSSEVFAAHENALDPTYEGPQAGYLMLKGEWNCARKPIEPLWTEHIGRLAGMLGARKVGSAPWQMGGAAGLEAEVVLPKRSNRRMWTAILEQGFTVLHWMVVHPLADRAQFEPVVTGIISSLRFLEHVERVEVSEIGLPLPPGYNPSDPRSLIPDIQDPTQWSAYAGEHEVGALQAFFLREAPHFGWEIEEYVPFPSPADLGFARLRLSQGERRLTLGLMPTGQDQVSAASPASLVIKKG